MTTTTLSDDQIRLFFFDNKLEIPAFFDASDVRALQAEADNLSDTAAALSPSVVKRSEAGLLIRLENFLEVAPTFAAVVPRLADVVGQLFPDNAPACLYKEKLNYKRAGGFGYAPHFDGPSVALPGLARDFITVEIAIDDQTVKNGCLQGVWPVHQCPDPPESALVPPSLDGDPDIDGRAGAMSPAVAAELPWRHMPCAAGTVTLFGHWFPHRSGINTSAHVRRTAYFIFNPATQGDQYARQAAHFVSLRAKYAEEMAQAARDLAVDLAILSASGVGAVRIRQLDGTTDTPSPEGPPLINSNSD